MNKFLLRNRIQDYVDNELSETEKQEVEQALAQHPDVMEEITMYQDLRERLLTTGTLQAPSNLLDNILLEVAQKPISANQPRSGSYLPHLLLIVAGFSLWFLIPDNPTPIVDTTPVKGAQTFPTANPVQLPSASPIEEANKHLASLEKKVDTQGITETIDTEDIPAEISTPTVKPTTPSKKNSSPTFVIQTPDTPYVPQWEGEQVITVGESTFDPEAFQFKSAPANLLFTLDNLAKEHQGTLRTSKEQIFSPVELTNFFPRAKCEIWVPTEHVEAINTQLTALGGQFFDDTIRQTSGFAIFKIDVRYQYY